MGNSHLDKRDYQDDYDLENLVLIGAGPHGKVYKSFHRRKQIVVALKIVKTT